MTPPKTRAVYVMAADDMQLSFTQKIDAVFSRSMLAGHVNTDTAATPADAAAAVVGGVWHEVPTYTRTTRYIDADRNMASQIQRKAHTRGGYAKDANTEAIIVPHGYTVLQRDIDGMKQYALVATDGHIHIL